MISLLIANSGSSSHSRGAEIHFGDITGRRWRRLYPRSSLGWGQIPDSSVRVEKAELWVPSQPDVHPRLSTSACGGVMEKSNSCEPLTLFLGENRTDQYLSAREILDGFLTLDHSKRTTCQRKPRTLFTKNTTAPTPRPIKPRRPKTVFANPSCPVRAKHTSPHLISFRPRPASTHSQNGQHSTAQHT